MLRFAFAVSFVSVSLFTLSSTGVAQMSQPGAREHEGRRICRTSQETGKLASRRRVCLTRAEWDRAAEEQRKVGQAWITAVDSCRDRANGGAQCQ